jgi:hypothetical protein
MKLISMLALMLCRLFSGQLLLAQSANRPPIPLKDLFDHLKISGATIPPDGKRLAFLAPENKRLNVWLCDTGRDLFGQDQGGNANPDSAALDLTLNGWRQGADH